MSTTTTPLRHSRPRGLNLAAIRLGARLVDWGRTRADRAAGRAESRAAHRPVGALTRSGPSTPEQLRERAAAQHEARAALEHATALTRLHIR